MGFFAKKVLEFQKKKLLEAETNLKSHMSKMTQLKATGSDKEITNEEKMIKIWSTNIEKIKKEIKKLEEKI